MQMIGTALGMGPRKDRQPVRGGSQRRGQCEQGFWRRTDRREVRSIVLEARRYERVGRKPGRENGPLGHVALEVLDLLANLVDLRTGRLEPSYVYLCHMLNRSKEAVSNALTALRVHGFLDRLRRFEATEREGRGPQVRQVTNAYRLTLPAKARRLLGRLMQDAPTPDDMVQERQERAAEREVYKAALPLDELARFEVEDDRLGRALADLGRRLRERESAARGEVLTEGF